MNYYHEAINEVAGALIDDPEKAILRLARIREWAEQALLGNDERDALLALVTAVEAKVMDCD